VVFAPGVEVVYPEGEDIQVGPLPRVATEPGLEDAYRPGHFEGVCQVVRRLFVLTGAGAGVFGAKDWQQLQVVRAMSADEGLGVEIVPGETVREADGLAMSSRNLLLDAESRERASAISRAIRAAATLDDPGRAEALMAEVIGEAGLDLEYAVVRDTATLGKPVPGQPCRLLVAARAGAVGGVGGVRLIDNGPWPQPQG
jgi:pantoate--beta-alanine ligase